MASKRTNLWKEYMPRDKSEAWLPRGHHDIKIINGIIAMKILYHGKGSRK